MRLNFAQLFSADHAQVRQAVGLASALQFLKTRQLGFSCCHDYLSAHLMWNVVLAAELHHGRRSGDTEAGLERTRFVVNAGMNDSAVVAALVAGDAIFFLQQEKTQAGKSPRDFESDGEADHASANDYHVIAGISHSGWSFPAISGIEHADTTAFILKDDIEWPGIRHCTTSSWTLMLWFNDPAVPVTVTV